MKPAECKLVRILKRLRSSVGYHELGMNRHALRCLDSLAQFGKIGPFALVVEILRDEFVKKGGLHTSAANALEIVAAMLPTPARHAVDLTLAACYGPSGNSARKINTAAVARGANTAVENKPAC